jgi:hypothetical protein
MGCPKLSQRRYSISNLDRSYLVTELVTVGPGTEIVENSFWVSVVEVVVVTGLATIVVTVATAGTTLVCVL